MRSPFTNLLQDGSDVSQGKRTEFAMLQKIIQILLKHLKHQAGVAFVLEAFIGAYKIILVCIFCT